MYDYQIGQEIELIKLEVLMYDDYVTPDIYTLISLCTSGQVPVTDLRISKYKAVVTSSFKHKDDKKGYLAMLTQEFGRDSYNSISDYGAEIACHKYSYEKHRYFTFDLTDVNAYDFCWENTGFSDFKGLFYLTDFISKIKEEYPSFVSLFAKSATIGISL